MAKEASNGNGQRKYWFIIPAVTVAGIVFGAGGMRVAVEKDVAANTTRNAEQTIAIAKNAETNQRQETVLARIDERLASIQKDVGHLLEWAGGK